MAVSSQHLQSLSPVELTDDNLDEVLDALSSIAPDKVINFGLKLNLTRNTIASFEIQYNRNMSDCLREILNGRLKQIAPLTWHDIVQALRSPSVNLHDLASQIESQYIPVSQSPSSVPQQESAESSHTTTCTSVPHSTLVPPSSQHSLHTLTSEPVAQAHTPVAPPQPSANNLVTGQPLQSSHPTHPSLSNQFLSQQPNMYMYTPHRMYCPPPHTLMHHPQYPPHYPSPQPPFYHSQCTPHPPTHHSQYQPQQHPTPHPPPQPSTHHSHYPPPQPPTHHCHYAPPQPPTHHSQYPPPQLPTHYPLPQPPTHHSQYPLQQHCIPNSLPPRAHTTPHLQPPSMQPMTSRVVCGTSYGHPSYMYPPNQIPPCQVAHAVSESYPHIPALKEGVAQFIDYVRAIYKSSEVERDTKVVKWPPTPTTVFINLACIDHKSVRCNEYEEITEAMVRDGNVDVIIARKGSIDFNEIAADITIHCDKEGDSKKRRVVLVEGAPGVGKSTFAWEFCRRWERGEIAQQYQLVLLLRLRDDRMSRAKSLNDLLCHPLKGVSEAVSKELVISHDFHALIILEGYDELPDNCRHDDSIFLQLISGKLLPLATVLVTSRPWATQRMRVLYGNRIYQHIEILGFTSHQITEYIESTLPQDKVRDLSLYLEKHPQIRGCMYIPLNSAIVVTVYQESQDGKCALPTTLTELYTALAQTLLQRYLRGSPECETGTKPMQSFKDLPLAVDAKFCELCQLAYSGITGSSDQVQLIFRGLPSNFDNLGFMDSVTELYATQGIVSSHNFLHLTFQEFFAAVHISNMTPTKQLEYFQRHKEGRLRVVLRFLAGITKLNCISKESVALLFEYPSEDEVRSRYNTPCDARITIDHVRWIFEAHSSDVITSLLERKTVDIRIDTSQMLPLDYYSLGYCIAHIQCQWVLTVGNMSGLERSEIGEEEVKMLVAGARTRLETSGRVVGLRGKWDVDYGVFRPLLISTEGLNMLFIEWKNVLHLHELALGLPVVQCSSIPWPDLSGLQVLKFGDWILYYLVSH